ncbi:hypothetical protein [Salinibaculum marinum]|uniref:LolA family protein n=1 Tax=Salinibaculum marinum TaxID=3131993 RepID=UPI0030D097D0
MPSPGPTPPLPPGEEAAEEYRSLDGYTATVDIDQSQDTDQRVRVWFDPDDGNSRAKILAPVSQAGNLYVANGSAIVQYNATSNEYIQVSTSGTDRFESSAQRVEAAVADARAGGNTTDGPPVGGAPLPVVPDAGEGTPESEGDSQGQFRVSYEGTQQIAGRTAHVLNYTAAGNRTQGILQQTLWLDTEHFVTLKLHQESRFGGNRSTYTYELSNVSFETDFGPDRFRFDPPPGATANRSESYDLTSFDSRDDLVAATDVPVPDPAVPGRYALVQADRIDGGTFDAVQLSYRATTSRLVVTKTSEQSYIDTSEGKPVAIGDRTGRFRSSGVSSIVVWECGEYIYVVAGDLPESSMVDVARSVACG